MSSSSSMSSKPRPTWASPRKPRWANNWPSRTSGASAASSASTANASCCLSEVMVAGLQFWGPTHRPWAVVLSLQREPPCRVTILRCGSRVSLHHTRLTHRQKLRTPKDLAYRRMSGRTTKSDGRALPGLLPDDGMKAIAIRGDRLLEIPTYSVNRSSCSKT